MTPTASVSPPASNRSTMAGVTTDQISTRASRAWLLSAVRAGSALAVGIAVVFVQDHSAVVGLVTALALFGLSAASIFILSAKAGPARGHMLALAAVHAVAAVAAAVLLFTAPEAAPLLTLLIVWAAASGVIELFASKKAAQHEVEGARDWRFVAIVTLAYAGLMALSPVVGLNDPVSLTGLLGAYAAVIGVFLLIGAASSALGAKATRTMSEVQ